MLWFFMRVREQTHTPSQTLLNSILITIFTLRTSNLVEVVVVSELVVLGSGGGDFFSFWLG